MNRKMDNNYDLILHGGNCVSHDGISRSDIALRDGRIVGIGDYARAKAANFMNVRGLHVLPGIIDSQVHFREPGAEHNEDLESGSRAAVLGGVTSVFEMPNTRPTTTSTQALDDKLDRASNRMWCDHAFFVGADKENIDSLSTLERHFGCCGIKLFMGSSTGDLLVDDDEDIFRVLKNGQRRIAVHSEDENRLRERRSIAMETGDVHAHAQWRDVETAVSSTRRLLRAARATGRRVHVLHVTTAEEMRLLADEKTLATVEVTPQHLTLASPSCYDMLGTLAQMNPPIRDKAHQEALWQGVREGIVDVLGSDHAPHSRKDKDKDYPSSPSGMPGVQTLLPLMLEHVAAGKLTIMRLVDLLCTGPARVFGIASKGRIAVGYDGDVTIVDLNSKRRIEESWLASKCGWSPFSGFEVRGWPVATIVRGRVCMREGELLGNPSGEPVRFQESLTPLSVR